MENSNQELDKNELNANFNQGTWEATKEQQDMYLEHLMSIMVNVLDHGFQKS